MKSIRCRLSYATWCEHFKSGECTSPVKCKYQTEHMSVNVPEAIFVPTKEAWEKMQAEIARLTAENAELRERLNRAVELPYMYEAELVDYAGHFIKTIYIVIYNNDGTIRAVQYSYKKVAEARLKELQGGER